MRRRALLAGLSGLFAGVAGCSQSTPNPVPTDEPTDSPTPTPPGPLVLVDRRIVERPPCDTGGQASVRYQPRRSRIVVDGCITGRNTCAQVQVTEASYDDQIDELTVLVGAPPEAQPGTSCRDATVVRGYRAFLNFEPRVPEPLRIVVRHQGLDDTEVASTTLAAAPTPTPTPTATETP